MQVENARTYSSVIDNQGENTLQVAIENITQQGRELCIATAFFSLDALAMVAKNLHTADSVRILFGDDASRTQRVELLRRLREKSDADLAEQRMIDPELSALKKVEQLFKQKKIQARCYTKLERHMRKHDCQMKREGGRHTIWEKAGTDKTASVPRHNDIKRNTARRICDDLAIPRPPGL